MVDSAGMAPICVVRSRTLQPPTSAVAASRARRRAARRAGARVDEAGGDEVVIAYSFCAAASVPGAGRAAARGAGVAEPGVEDRAERTTVPGPWTVASRVLPERVLATRIAWPWAPSSSALPWAVSSKAADW